MLVNAALNDIKGPGGTPTRYLRDLQSRPPVWLSALLPAAIVLSMAELADAAKIAADYTPAGITTEGLMCARSSG
jgi:hypothetical protein